MADVVAKGNAYGEGVPVKLRGGRTVYVHALSFAAMKRTKEARTLIQERKFAPDTDEWREAAITLIHASVIEGGDDITREELEGLLTSYTSSQCFRAMTAAQRGLTALSEEVADESEERPSRSLNGTGSTPTLSPTQVGPGSNATN